MKSSLFAATLALAAVALPGIASAASFFDPAESEWSSTPAQPNPANAAAAKADAARYVGTQTYYDPAESGYVTVNVPENPTVITTHSSSVAPAPVRNGGWDPADN